MTNKKLLLIAMIMLLVLSCVFSTDFSVYHVINSAAKGSYQCRFIDSQTGSTIAEKPVDSNDIFYLASFIIEYNGELSELNLSLSFSDLVTADKQSYYPYTMYVCKPNGDPSDSGQLYSVSLEDGGHGAGVVVFFSNGTLSKYDNSVSWNSRTLADLYIDLGDEDEVAAGDYSATVTINYQGI